MKKYRNLQAIIILTIFTFAFNLKNHADEWNFQFCKDNKKLTKQKDDLFNPLSKTFRRLLKGFCIFKARNNKPKPESSNSIKEVEIDYNSLYKLKEDNKTAYSPLPLKMPVLLPSGRCSKSFIEPVNLLQNKNVTCKVKKEYNIKFITEEFIGKIESDSTQIKCINKTLDKYNKIIESDSNSSYIRHIKVIYLVDYKDDTKEIDKKPICQQYFYNNNYNSINALDYLTVTFEVLFEKENQAKYSGNFGYIRSYPIIFRNDSQVFKYPRLLNKLVYSNEFGICNYDDPNALDNKKVYYDINFDPSISFHDTIIYGCQKKNDAKFPGKKIIELKENLNISLYGKYTEKNWTKIKDGDNLKETGTTFALYLLNFKTGKVKNYHNVILSSKINNVNIETNNQIYFIIKIFTTDNGKKWFDPNPPDVDKLPYDVMYPFESNTQRKDRINQQREEEKENNNNNNNNNNKSFYISLKFLYLYLNILFIL